MKICSIRLELTLNQKIHIAIQNCSIFKKMELFVCFLKKKQLPPPSNSKTKKFHKCPSIGKKIPLQSGTYAKTFPTPQKYRQESHAKKKFINKKSSD